VKILVIGASGYIGSRAAATLAGEQPPTCATGTALEIEVPGASSTETTA
jgi:uncharacterized protein YbjT (DUF2867 family)